MTRKLWSPTLAASGWAESTLAERTWDRSRGAGRRWALFGVAAGTLAGVLACAPAAWLADAVASLTGQRLVLADARGTVWDGSALVVVTGGRDSRDASTLPGRLAWTLRPQGLGLGLQARHACCLNGVVGLQFSPGIRRNTLTLQPPAGWVGQWPTALLAGLGTPWNTLALGGSVRLASNALVLEAVAGRWIVDGRADLDLVGVSSRLTTLESLGSYRVSLVGDAAIPGVAQVTLSTREGALQLSGSGTWTPAGVRFRGEARAGAAEEAALANLLNIIGRRDGARSVISIG